jgi:hypothetical protein|tara:strand:+ start:281 stop:589 length:309 start_codon:yes stop_codon:yes gene_type:complete
MYEFNTESSLILQSASGHIGHDILDAGLGGSGTFYATDGYQIMNNDYNTVKLVHRIFKVLVTGAPFTVTYRLQPIANLTTYFTETGYGNNKAIHAVSVKYLG